MGSALKFFILFLILFFFFLSATETSDVNHFVTNNVISKSSTDSCHSQKCNPTTTLQMLSKDDDFCGGWHTKGLDSNRCRHKHCNGCPCTKNEKCICNCRSIPRNGIEYMCCCVPAKRCHPLHHPTAIYSTKTLMAGCNYQENCALEPHIRTCCSHSTSTDTAGIDVSRIGCKGTDERSPINKMEEAMEDIFSEVSVCSL